MESGWTHVHQREDDCWSRKITEWKPREEKRAVGRLKLRWSDAAANFINEKHKHIKMDKQKIAQDGNTWLTHGKVYIKLCIK